MRDYGTGEWAGGDTDCDHKERVARKDERTIREIDAASGRRPHASEYASDDRGTIQFAAVCGKCGARRVDQQLGLEPTPELYVARMVEVFREVKRVMRTDATLWCNMGDSFLPDKQMAGIPWRLAFALQADGWILRSDIIWAKKNCMPESVTDRPTKSHEYVFLLTKSPRYFFDQEPVRERYVQEDFKSEFRAGSEPYLHQNGPLPNGGRGPDGRRKTSVVGADGSIQHRDGERWPNPAGRNVRTVWDIATQPYPEAHFATYPEELVRRCVLAGSPQGGLVLDPFLGSGTTAYVARKHGRRSIGIELNPAYADLAARRMAQQSLEFAL